MKRLSHKIKKQYLFQEWLCTNIWQAGDKTRHLIFQKLFKLPAGSTIRKFLLKLEDGLSVRKINSCRLYVKVAPKRGTWKNVLVAIGRNAFTTRLVYKCIKTAFRSKGLATSSRVNNVVALTRSWEFPLRHYFSSDAVSKEKLKKML